MKTTLLMVIAFFIGLATMQFWYSQNSNSLTLLTTEENTQLGLPFSEATRIGNTLYVSGQIGVKLGTLTLVPGGIKAQTTQTLDNIKVVLERYGSSMNQVAKCSIFLADMDQWPLMNEAYVEAFGKHRPARSAFAASGLALGGAVEIECIAFVE